MLLSAYFIQNLADGKEIGGVAVERGLFIELKLYGYNVAGQHIDFNTILVPRESTKK